MNLLAGLNDQQQAAVIHDAGPLLVVAGAGSGKTRVLTHRIAHLVHERGVSPYEILAITFTNKAADEMRERVGRLVGDRFVGLSREEDGTVRVRRWGGMWVATFHSACSRLLRQEAHVLGYNNRFTIYDTADSTRLVGLCINDLGIDPKKVTPRGAAAAISRAKNELVDFDTFALRAREDGTWYDRQVAEIYRTYQGRLHRASAFDFDDLLVKTVELFELFDEVLDRWRQRFKYVLVDEWQDTNHAQYELVRLLCWEHRNLSVVGDSDQSIYGFRGADIRNILDFEVDFPDATRITLERNYRSTQTILDAANAVIAHNLQRLEKRLWTDAGAGAPIVCYTGENEHDEAAFVVDEITRLTERGDLSPGDCAVFYRTNAQSRVMEEVLVRLGMPYQVIGGTRFYERAEVKDLLAYLRAIVNPADDVSVRRVLNVPRRGIGARTEAALDVFAGQERTTFMEACRRAKENPQLSGRAVGAVTEFVQLLDELRAAVDTEELSLRQIIELVWTRTRYLAELETERTVEALGRVENVRELATVADEFAARQPDATLPELLESIALISEQDELGEGTPRLVLMTMHNAKGLEFPAVFCVGMEESVFPHHLTLGNPDALEEERRLCYVAMTRAQQRLYLTRAWQRMLFGATNANPPSRFLREVPAKLIENRSDDLGGPSRRSLAKAGVWSQYARDADTDDGELVVGDRILHPRFGPGQILELSGRPGSEEAVIRFDESGTKRLALAYAPLVRA